MPSEAHKGTRRSAFAKSSSYIPGLDGIRAVAFLCVFFSHALGRRYGAFFPATLGVTVFFFLSGYLITTLLRRELEKTGTISLRDFYIRRTLRIFAPLYVTYALACLLAWATHMEVGNWQGALSVVLYFFNYASNFHWSQLLPHGMDVVWSLDVEEHFYLLFPLAMLAMWRRQWSWRKQAWVLTALCLVAPVWRVFIMLHTDPGWHWTYRATDSRFDSILWGSILALAFNPRFRDRPLMKPERALPIFLLSFVLLVATMLLHNNFYRDTLHYTLQGVLMLPLFAFVISNSDHPLVRWLEWPPVRYIGWLSYVLYLCHLSVVATLEHYTSNRWIHVLGGLALAMAYAIVMRYTLELPLQRIRARFRRVPENDPTAPDGHGLIS
jgi:peptidoglycan/LPS O-acetylase OafA/YrhL